MNTWNALRPARATLHGLTFLFLLALVASCDTDNIGPEAVTLLTVGGDVGAQLQNLTITRAGAAVTRATVTINGVVIPHTGTGNYQGELPAAVPAGSPLNLQVSVGETTVQGIVNVPEAPVLTEPATGSDTATAGSIHVGWTSATNPDRFVVSASWVSRGFFLGAHVEKTFSASGSARELEIDSIEAGTDVTISVVAYNDGSFTGQVDPNSRLSAGSESSPNAGITTESAPLLILGDMGAQLQNLTVTREGVAVTDATVTINGVGIPHTGTGNYQGELPAAVPAGSPLNLEVSAGGATVQGTVTVPEVPVLTAPPTGAAFEYEYGDTITVSWTTETNPDRFVVWMGLVTVPGSRFDITFPVAGTNRELDIPLLAPPLAWAGPGTTFSVSAYNDGSFTGQVDPESRMSVGIESSPDAGITTEPAPLLILGEMEAQFQKLTVAREGVAVTDATVTINGVAIPHAGAGLYQGSLPTAVPAGSPLDLQVSAGGSTVQGTVNVPEAPVLTAPVTEADIDAGGDSITVTWTSTTDPERFVASWIFDGVPFGKTYTAAGTARELRIAARPANTKLPLSLAACNDGSFSGPAHLDSRMGICAQSLPNAASPLRISGSVGAQSQDIWVFQGWDYIYGVNDAVVTVNGVTVPPTALPGHYHGELPAAVPPGSPLDLRVSARGLIVEATGDVPEVPVLTAPAPGAVFAPGASVTFRWTSTTSPDRFMISVGAAHLYLPGTARELTIPTSGLPAGADITISLVAYNDRSFSGPAHPFSRIKITSVGDPRVITINH